MSHTTHVVSGIVAEEQDRLLRRYARQLAGAEPMRIERYIVTVRRMRDAGEIDPAWAAKCLRLAESLQPPNGLPGR
jgi:hypothetical protein